MVSTNSAPRKRNSGDAGLEDGDGEALNDTATSPLKPVLEAQDNGSEKPAAQKKLDMSKSNALALVVPPPPPGEKVWEWRPSSVLAGQRFQKEAEVDEVLGQAAEQIKTQIRQGYTVVVK